KPVSWLTVDGDLASSSARFTDFDPVGDHIPGAATTVISFGVAVPDERRISGGFRWRYFGPRPLIEDDRVRSPATSLVNANLGYRIRKDLRLSADVINVLNQSGSDVDYYYASRLPGEPLAGVDDIHTHPITGRTVRVGLVLGF